MMLKLIAIEAIILISQIVLYFGCELPQHDCRNVRRAIDERIAFMPGFVCIYVMWFPLVALFPIALYSISPYEYTVYQLSIITSNVTTTIIYVLFPTSFERPVPGGSFYGKLLRTVYICDFKGSNCSPSLHCIQCFIIALSTCICPEIYGISEVLIIIVTTAIVFSTLFTKQHVVQDVITAVPVAIWSYIAGCILTHHFEYTVILSSVGLV